MLRNFKHISFYCWALMCVEVIGIKLISNFIFFTIFFYKLKFWNPPPPPSPLENRIHNYTPIVIRFRLKKYFDRSAPTYICHCVGITMSTISLTNLIIPFHSPSPTPLLSPFFFFSFLGVFFGGGCFW